MARVKAKDTEDLSDNTIERVIEALERDNPITKKVACEMLRISYNTSRLSTIIENFKEKKARHKALVDSKKGKPASLEETKCIIEEYLSGEPISEIARRNYRGESFIRTLIKKYSVPTREQGSDYWNVPLIPDEAIKTEFQVGEKVYSARYQSLATIKGVTVSNGENVYRIWLDAENWQQFAYQPWYELASLEHLRSAGVL